MSGLNTGTILGIAFVISYNLLPERFKDLVIKFTPALLSLGLMYEAVVNHESSLWFVIVGLWLLNVVFILFFNRGKFTHERPQVMLDYIANESSTSIEQVNHKFNSIAGCNKRERLVATAEFYGVTLPKTRK